MTQVGGVTLLELLITDSEWIRKSLKNLSMPMMLVGMLPRIVRNGQKIR